MRCCMVKQSTHRPQMQIIHPKGCKTGIKSIIHDPYRLVVAGQNRLLGIPTKIDRSLYAWTQHLERKKKRLYAWNISVTLCRPICIGHSHMWYAYLNQSQFPVGCSFHDTLNCVMRACFSQPVITWAFEHQQQQRNGIWRSYVCALAPISYHVRCRIVILFFFSRHFWDHCEHFEHYTRTNVRVRHSELQPSSISTYSPEFN